MSEETNPKVSIVICSLNRETNLKKCLTSIEEQSFKNYEIILCQEEGCLVELKNQGWKKAKGEIVVFCDDDIVMEKDWLENMVKLFDYRPDVVGATGPTYVPLEFIKNRDILKNNIVKPFYNWFFLENKQYFPGKITSCGANTYGGDFPTPISNRVHEVDFLQPSQFGIRKSILEKVNGFDLGYEGISEWCDVDLCYRIKEFGKLIYHPRIKVYHFPVNDTTAKKRLETASRYRNYCRWADKFIKPTFKHRIYRIFLKTYFFLKNKGWI